MTVIERNTRWTAGSAVVLVAIAFAVSIEIGQAAIAGAFVACGSAFVVQRLVLGLSKAGDRARPMLALLLVSKSALVLGASAGLLFMFRLNGIGFALGVSALVVGAMGAAVTGFDKASDAPRVLAPEVAPPATGSGE